ncbi:MAG TPA: GWxTD domain-containing protein [Bacteroidota bacterium]|nr:GWxTD domain-containing protein [Bacteroidota bacterium]
MHNRTIVLTLLILAGARSFAQDSPANGNRLRRMIHQGDSLLAQRKYPEAGDFYNAALQENPRSVEAALGLGKAEMGTRSWSSALGWFEKAAAIDTGNLEAQYYRGISFRERGRERIMLEKVLGIISEDSFEKGRGALAWVLRRDSTYRDALFQTALCYSVEKEYGAALPIALKQILVAPEIRNAHSGFYQIIREAIGVQETHVRPGWLKVSAPSYNAYIEAEWERQKGRLDQAERLLSDLLPNPGLVRRPLILEALAKIKARMGQTAEAERLGLEAIDNIRTLGDADIIFEDVKYIINDEELTHYRQLRTGTEAKKFFSTFWSKRNPYPAEQSNERIAEHFRRLIYAEQWFQQFGRKTYSEETMPLDFPQSYYLNEEFNDKGIIYLRHGEPHEKVVTARTGDEPAESNESWIYHATDEYPQMMFDFYIPKGAHVTEWRLVPVLPDREMWEDRADYSRAYLRLVQAQSSAAISESILRATDEAKEMYQMGVTSDRFAYTKSIQYFDSPISITCFRGEFGRTLVSIGYVIAPSEIAKAFPDSVGKFDVVAEYSIYDSLWRRVATAQKQEAFQRAHETGDMSIDRFQAGVVPDSYTVAWQAKPVGANQVFSRKLRALVPDFSGTSLMMSDLELAYDIGPADKQKGFVRGSLSVIPNPLMRCPLNRPLYLYFEAYNLKKDAGGKTSYTIEYQLKSLELEKSFLARLLTTTKKTSITVPSERSGTSDWSPEYVAIDVGELEAGRYQLQVKLTDNVAKMSVLRSINADIYQKR